VQERQHSRSSQSELSGGYVQLDRFQTLVDSGTSAEEAELSASLQALRDRLH